jgi:hypothetical protein
MGLAAVADHKLAGFISVGAIFNTSIKIGRLRSKNSVDEEQPKSPFQVLQ